MERSAVLEDVSPASLADAAARSLQELNRFLGRASRTEVSEEPGLYRWRTGIPHPYFSGVIAATRPGADAQARVREAVAAFEASGTRAFSWWL
ncbi:MAG TPA: hypothetical protein VFM17_10350, partial [Candidatus Eisenbacteria bacterium]|nr:hypothetical protein [Candidatus Eisenbacteria bacterium]